MHLQAFANFLEITFLLLLDDRDHLLADFADLRGLGVRGLGDLCAPSLGETNAKQTEHVAVGGLDVYPCLNKRVPLLDERADLIACQVHAVEVGQDLVALVEMKNNSCTTQVGHAFG